MKSNHRSIREDEMDRIAAAQGTDQQQQTQNERNADDQGEGD